MTDMQGSGSMQMTIPVLALRGLTVFPQLMLHFDVGRAEPPAPASFPDRHSCCRCRLCSPGRRERLFSLPFLSPRYQDPRPPARCHRYPSTGSAVFSSPCPDPDQTERILIYLVRIFQIDHKPSLSVSLFCPVVEFPHRFPAFRQHLLRLFLLLFSDDDHHGKIRLSRIYGTECFPRFSILDIPAGLHTAAAVLYLFLTAVLFLYL